MAGGGGAWKVAYADFVTAMMAFFLVMWITSQDSKVKKSVADYFSGQGTVRVGARHPSQTGGPFATRNHGSIPHSQDVFLGRGRETHSPQREHGKTTKMVSSWLSNDEKASKYWREQGAKQRELAGRSKDVLKQGESVNQVAVQQLAKQIKDEITQGLFSQAKGLYQDLLYETIGTINWDEVAEDILSQE